MELEILYRDTDLIAINKPHGLLVHKTRLANDTEEFALQILRDQVGCHVYPAHRIDRKTGGVLLFAFNQDVLPAVRTLFDARKISKTYLAIVRGYTDDSGLIDYPLRNENGKVQDAVTDYETIERVEVAMSLGRYPTQRYSLVKVRPHTGRMHQIRKHFAHILHPIIGDRPHGCNKQNKYFKEQWNMTTMLLHAYSLEFTHPVSDESVFIQAQPGYDFMRMSRLLGFTYKAGDRFLLS